MKTIVVALILLLALGGCALAPGMKMRGVPQELIPGEVESVPITVDLIMNQQLLKRTTGRDMAAARGVDRGQAYHYRIGPRDILNVTVWDHPELTIPAGEFRSVEAAGHLVAEDGSIFYPYAGKVEVADKTVGEVRETLTRRISRAISNPQLDVRVAAFRSQKVFIVGEVEEPGPQAITDVPLTIVEAINNAGGVTSDADMVNVTLGRNGTLIDVNLLSIYEGAEIAQNLILQNGDILHVPDRNLQKVFVLGEVSRPSSLLMHKGRMTLSEAISDAGGVDRVSSNPSRIYVIRHTPDKTHIYHLDSKSPQALILGDQFALAPRDVVYVETAGVTRWNRVIEQLLPTTTLLRNLSDIESEQFDEP